MLGGYLHGGAVSLAPDQRGWDIGVGILIIQIYHVGHPPWQEQLIPLVGLVLEQNAVDVATWRGGKRMGELLLRERWTSPQQSTFRLSETSASPLKKHASSIPQIQDAYT